MHRDSIRVVNIFRYVAEHNSILDYRTCDLCMYADCIYIHMAKTHHGCCIVHWTKGSCLRGTAYLRYNIKNNVVVKGCTCHLCITNLCRVHVHIIIINQFTLPYIIVQLCITYYLLFMYIYLFNHITCAYMYVGIINLLFV